MDLLKYGEMLYKQSFGLFKELQNEIAPASKICLSLLL